MTLDAYGMVLISADNPSDYQHYPAIAKKVVDVIGAGDSAFATLSLCFAVGISLNEAVEVASFASSIAVGKLGTYPVTKDEILTFLS